VLYLRQSSDDQVREHRGSLDAQLDQAEYARRWGWPESQIVITNKDLGVSGTASSNRPGFLELVDQIGRGDVGMVLVHAIDRLSRNTGDFIHILDLMQQTDTLLCVDGTVYNPASDDLSQMLALQVQGMFGAFDNQLRARRLMAARVARASRDEAVSPPPTGYIRSGRGRWIKDPDPQVQETILRIFDLYSRLGSLSKVVRYFRDHGHEFPRRVGDKVMWGPCDAALVHSVLRNRAHAGDYVFRRRRSQKRAGKVMTRMRPRSEWIEVRDHHEAYIPRAFWEHIQQMLASRRPRMTPVLGKGDTLLQGIIRDATDGCDRMMHTQFSGRAGMARTGSYTCVRQNGWGDPTHRVVFPARFIDHAVSHHVLEALGAIDHETASSVVESGQLEHAAAERVRQRQLQDAEAEVQKIRALALKLPAELQHARVDLMEQYNTAVARVAELKRQRAAAGPPPASLTSADVDELIRRTANVRQLWAAPARTNADRKRLVRAVITEVVIREVTHEAAQIEIVWKGGLRERVPVRRPRGVDAAVRDLTLQGKSAASIADELNAAGVVTQSGRPLSTNVVGQKQRSQGLGLNEERRLAREIIHRELMANTPRPEIRGLLRDQAPRLGPWDPQKLSDFIRDMRRRASDVEPLPQMLPADDGKQRALALTNEALAEGKNWKEIAVLLNDAGLRPPRGTAFTPTGVRLLYMRAHNLTSFKLPMRPDSNGAGV